MGSSSRVRKMRKTGGGAGYKGGVETAAGHWNPWESIGGAGRKRRRSHGLFPCPGLGLVRFSKLAIYHGKRK